jgi:transcription elongation factor Elf1
MFNPNTTAKYLANPDECPHCNSEHLSADTMENDTNTCWRQIRCVNCDKEWREVYQLASIEENS